MNGKKILVTGGAGFIGSHVVRALTQKGARVCIFDCRHARVPGVECIEGDLRDYGAVTHAMEGVDGVVHLAAIVSVPQSVKDPLETHEVNVTGTTHVFEAARTLRKPRVVYASSAAVYGDEPTLPKREETPLRPQSPYALSKLQNEQTARLYGDTFGVASAGLRFFNVYGPGQSADHAYASVIPKWIAELTAGRDPQVFGDGEQTRDFVQVTDVACAIIAALDASFSGARVYNIASGTEMSLNDLFRRLCAAFPGRTLVRMPEREGDIRRSVADISRARSELSFSPSVSFDEGLDELLP
jgi:nucleoside-diphosphate-sugar epimerase